MQYKNIQKSSVAVCLTSIVGIIGTLGGYGNGNLNGRSFVLFLLLFMLLLASNIFIIRLVGNIARLNRRCRRMGERVKEMTKILEKDEYPSIKRVHIKGLQP